MSEAPVPIDLLLSFAFHDKLDHHDVKRRLPPGSLMWIDSGAFTAFTTGKTITVAQYAEHLERTKGAWDYAFTLDVIGDHAASMRQTEELIGLGYPVVPIFTFGTPLAEFRSMCRDFGYVGAGGVVPLGKDRRAQTKYLRTLTAIADEHGTAVHALGVGGRTTIIQSRVWSADSSTISSAPLYGNVPIYNRKRKRLKLLQASDREGLYRYRDDLLHYGFPLDAVMRAGKWTSEERPAMFRASLLSYADMWADLRRDHPCPAPERLPLPAGEGAPHTPPDGPRPAYAYADFGVPIEPVLDELSEKRGPGPRTAAALNAEGLTGVRGASAIGAGPYVEDAAVAGSRVASALGRTQDAEYSVGGNP